MKFLALLVVLISVQQAHAEWWQTALVCDNGAARVDVDLGERRNVRLVITNQDIRKYLASTGITELSQYDGDTVRARVDQGIFNSSQFRGFKRQGFTLTCSSGSGPTIFANREGNGLKVSGRQEFAEGCCWEMDSGGGCTNKGADVPQKDLGNWYFQNCQEQPIIP